ncbi:MAG: transcription-repair coupling factor [Candidatus Hinthialibacter antarcticus]|nr:transcription-repair coupling factor [Candidatus Hinthialibacter antarcticus]
MIKKKPLALKTIASVCAESAATDVFQSLQQRIKERDGLTMCGQAVGSSRAMLIAALAKAQKKPVVVITAEQSQAYILLDDVQFFLGDDADDIPVYVYPHLEILPYEAQAPELTIRMERLGPIQHLMENKNAKASPMVVIAPIAAAMKLAPPMSVYEDQRLLCTVGSELNRDAVAKWLVDQGYEFRDLVAQRGDFSIRGDIIDIYSFSYPEPVRIELWGDEVDSIRLFNVSDQRSMSKLKEAVFYPGAEDPLIRAALSGGVMLEPLPSLFGDDALMVLSDPEEIEKEAENFFALVNKRYSEETAGDREDHELHLSEEDFHKHQDVLLEPTETLYCHFGFLEQEAEARGGVGLTEFTLEPDEGHLNLGFGTPEIYGEERKERIQSLMKVCEAGGRVAIVCDNEGQQHRLDEILETHLKDANLEAGASVPTTCVGTMHRGFVRHLTQTLVCTDREIFGRYRRFRTPMREGIALPVTELIDLKPGDYVVHIDHGIGKFVKLLRMEHDGREGEYLELEYADGGKLFTPIEQIDRVGRYIGGENVQPTLAKLGTKSWERTKTRAKEAIEDMADELLELYAARQIHTGHSFNKDTTWQHEFEASFLYEETPDQWRAIEEVKRDMEGSEPMDRLICGDVGFGKTEVAIRAAFKALMDGKQVAVLAPTTILCQQHYENFQERYADYPIKVESLSRFNTTGEQKQVVEAMKAGEVDLVVGTHRLLSKDVAFKDLGLVVVDEEQRFGVKHKERLRQIRKLVDTLTLTATPIPRTLYMSMSGIRNMSLMSTPPKNRLPIETYVMEWSMDVVENAILRELSRDGQVYVVHNRIESIYQVANRIHELVPDARICVGHGQMGEHELEDVMHKFIHQEYDILVATTIIENGLDIPNVNTIIINDADHFGLSQLYQLRGRVGRDRHRAYCYLLVPSKKALSSISRRRLLALQEHNQLGSGFHLAMRDMELRGIGNILGRQQHGHIAAIGFDLYSKLLSDTVAMMRGKKGMQSEWETSLEISPKGSIPPGYVESSKQRMSLHQRIAKIKNREEIETLREELTDIYGKPPASVERLFQNLSLRVRAQEAGLDVLQVFRNRAFLRYHQSQAERFDPLRVLHLDGWEGWKLTIETKDENVGINIDDAHKRGALPDRIEAFLDALDAKEAPRFTKPEPPPNAKPKTPTKPKRKKIKMKLRF